MESTVSVLELRRHLGELLKRVSEGRQRLMVSKRGKLQVVVISPEEYFARIVPRDEVLGRLQMQAQEKGLDSLGDAEIEAEIRKVRKELERHA